MENLKQLMEDLKKLYDYILYLFNESGEFPSQPVVRNLLPHCQGSGINLWLGN